VRCKSCNARPVFIVCFRAGSGILALPYAVAGSGWIGIFFIVLCCVASAQAAVYLGRCWNIIEERWPEYKALQADPYSIIGLRAYGRKTQVLVSLSVSVQLYGVAIVFLALCSDLIYGFLGSTVGITSCEWIIIVGLVSLPFMWLPTPAEISFIAYTAMSCTAISCVLLVIIFCQEFSNEYVKPEPAVVDTNSFFLSLGTIAFVYGGAATFPTFQNFMKDKRQFPKAVFAGFTSRFLR